MAKRKLGFNPILTFIVIAGILLSGAVLLGLVDLKGLMPGTILSVSNISMKSGDKIVATLVVDGYDRVYGISKEEINNELKEQGFEAQNDIVIAVKPKKNVCTTNLDMKTVPRTAVMGYVPYWEPTGWTCQSQFEITVRSDKAGPGFLQYSTARSEFNKPILVTGEDNVKKINAGKFGNIIINNIGQIKSNLYTLPPTTQFIVLQKNLTSGKPIIIDRVDFVSKMNICKRGLLCPPTDFFPYKFSIIPIKPEQTLNFLRPVAFGQCASYNQCKPGQSFVDVDSKNKQGIVTYKMPLANDRALITIEFDKAFVKAVKYAKPEADVRINSFTIDRNPVQGTKAIGTVVVENIGATRDTIRLIPHSKYGLSTFSKAYLSDFIEAKDKHTFEFAIEGYTPGNDSICVKAQTTTGKETERCASITIKPIKNIFGGETKVKAPGSQGSESISPPIEGEEAPSPEEKIQPAEITCPEGYVLKKTTSTFFLWTDETEECVKPIPMNSIVSVVVILLVSVGIYMIGKKQRWWK